MFLNILSLDSFLGGPWNIASYALLTHMVAHVTGLRVGEFIWTIGDGHIYSNHVEQVDLLLSRTPHQLPTLAINRATDNIFELTYDDFDLIGYHSDATIAAPVSV